MRWTYIAACVVIPAVWGAFVAHLFGRLDARRRTPKTPPPVDYMI